MTTLTACNVATIATYIPSAENPWNEQKVNHLYRRIGFGATRVMINDALQKTPEEVIDALIDEAINLSPSPAPEWASWVYEDFAASGFAPFKFRRDVKNLMVDNMFKNNLRDRLTLFWSNHFVTEGPVYASPAYMFQYHNILQFHSIGNFRDFTTDIGLTSAMLVYLNGRENTKNKPNENYARELYELFTLGVNNGYTQQDIVETAKALTGWNKRPVRWGPISFDNRKFDNNNKTIFGQRGNWGYHDVIRILFEQRTDQIAKFICTKLYRYFVGPVVNEEIVDQLADIFKNNNFEIAPVLRKLFKSQHFFDEASFGVIIKSPIELQVSFFKELEFEMPTAFEFNNKIRVGADLFGQNLLSPVDVAGWQGDTDWVGSSTLTGRWDRMRWYIERAWRHDRDQFRKFVIDLMGNDPTVNDVELVSRSIINHFLSKELISEIEYTQALEIFKDQVPENYFEDGTWNLEWGSVPRQVFKLLLHINTIPELQLK